MDTSDREREREAELRKKETASAEKESAGEGKDKAAADATAQTLNKLKLKITRLCMNGCLKSLRKLLPTYERASMITSVKNLKMPIHTASENGKDEVIRFLLGERLVPTECRTKRGDTPLILAAVHNHHRSIVTLIDCNASLEAQGKYDRTALHEACVNDSVQAVSQLIDCKANLEARDYNDMTPIMTAAKLGQLGIVKLLYEANADLNATDFKGYTSLLWAICSNRVSVVKFLVNEIGVTIPNPDTGCVIFETSVRIACLQIQKMIKKARKGNHNGRPVLLERKRMRRCRTGKAEETRTSRKLRNGVRKKTRHYHLRHGSGNRGGGVSVVMDGGIEGGIRGGSKLISKETTEMRLCGDGVWRTKSDFLRVFHSQSSGKGCAGTICWENAFWIQEKADDSAWIEEEAGGAIWIEEAAEMVDFERGSVTGKWIRCEVDGGYA
jgi:ankyrin repeat protein